MKYLKRYLFAALLGGCILLTAVAYYSIHWKIGEGYAIKFSTHKVEGTFTDLKGKIKFDPNKLDQSEFDVVVAVASIETGIGLKNKHARGEHFFEEDRYPEIRFKSSSVSQASTGYETKGILDMHGVQKEIVIPFTFEGQTFKGQFELNRLDYKVGPETGMYGTVGTVLKVELNVPAVQ